MIMIAAKTQLRIAALAFGAASVLAVDAQSQPAAPGAPCRIVWDGATSGGDTQTMHAELQLTRSAPQADGSLIMFGSGQGTVTYRSGAGLRITRGSPFIAKLTVVLSSENGRTADIDIDTAPDEPDHEIVADPGGFTFDTEAEAPPTVTVPLQDGVTASYSEFLGAGARRHGKTGTMTLHYCR
jgi:hypothetical protein